MSVSSGSGRVCPVCRQHKPESQFYRNPAKRACKECMRVRMRSYRQELRDEVLHHYGGAVPACACCGETHQEFLQIHHVDGNGAEHRRELARGRSSRSGGDIYWWLRKNGFPQGNYAILCANCNVAIHLNGYCPHHGPDHYLAARRLEAEETNTGKVC